MEDNPILEYVKYFVFENPDFDKFKIERPSKFGGDIEFSNYNQLETLYIKKEVHPKDLKDAISRYLNEMIEPVRKAFDTNSKMKDLRDQVLSFTVTR